MKLRSWPRAEESLQEFHGDPTCSGNTGDTQNPPNDLQPRFRIIHNSTDPVDIRGEGFQIIGKIGFIKSRDYDFATCDFFS